MARIAARRPTAASAVAETRAWVERAVIGLRLCPYAGAPHRLGRVRYACSHAREPDALVADLADEIRRLVAAPPETIETTLLVHPWVLRGFEAYNAFLDVADALLDTLGATGLLQVASFHPDYRFAGARADDIANATNRSPHPMLQLLREASVAAAVDAGADAEAIVDANVATLRRLGAAGWDRLRAQCRADALAAKDAANATPPSPPRPRGAIP